MISVQVRVRIALDEVVPYNRNKNTTRTYIHTKYMNIVPKTEEVGMRHGKQNRRHKKHKEGI